MEEYRILIVEDVKAAHLLYEQALLSQNKDYIIKCVDRGSEALKELRIHKYNIVLLDINLPDMRGEEVLEKIRSRGMDVPVLILTAFAEKSLVLNVTGFGIHDYLLKPVDLNMLRERVSEILLGKKEVVIKNSSKKEKNIDKKEKVVKKEVVQEYDPKYLWKKKVICPVCAHEFETYNYKNKSQALKEKESDFHEIYDKFDPIMYDIYVCPSCFFASTISEFDKLKAREMEILFNNKRSSTLDYSKNRTIDMALESYDLAIHCKNQTEKPNEALLANLYIKKAWLYRGINESNGELKNLSEALHLYEKKYLTASNFGGALSGNGLAYLIAELSRRVGDYNKAQKYFGILINSQDAKKEKYIYSLAKRQYEILKEEKK